MSCGPLRYHRMAAGLARSIRLHSPSTRLAVVTDSECFMEGRLFDVVVRADPSFGTGLAQKLHLDIYSPFEETIFIDSDCLVYGDVAAVWRLLGTDAGIGICGWGYEGPSGRHYAVHDLATYLASCRIERLGLLNSGVFYFSRSRETEAVFSSARRIYAQRDTIGLLSPGARGVNDEPVLAAAMEQNGVSILPWDNGRVMSTAIGDVKGLRRINVLTGASSFTKMGSRVEPLVIHFNVHMQRSYTYLRELWRLRLPRLLGRAGVADVMACVEAWTVRLWRRLHRLAPRVRRGPLSRMCF